MSKPTQQELNSGNRTIAEYHGWKFNPNGTVSNPQWMDKFQMELDEYDIRILHRYTGIEWLYPVYQKVIRELGSLSGDNTDAELVPLDQALKEAIAYGAEPTEIWKHIVATIEWVNKQKK